MTDNAELKGLMDEATARPWQVISQDKEYWTGNTHATYFIATAWVHGQLKDFAPVVSDCLRSLKDGPEGGVSVSKEDAALITAAVNELPRLLADSEALAAEREKVAQLEKRITELTTGAIWGDGRFRVQRTIDDPEYGDVIDTERGDEFIINDNFSAAMDTAAQLNAISDLADLADALDEMGCADDAAAIRAALHPEADHG